MGEFQLLKLENGLRAVFERSRGEVAHLVVAMKAGARYDQPGLEGTAHFIEHCLFKGTEKRKTHHVLTRLDAVGGELNAYTTREEMCIHASFEKRHLARAAELLQDIVFHSSFPKKEVDREREVIRDELRSYEDSPSDKIFDDFEKYLFPDHPLGTNIIGSDESLDRIGPEQLKEHHYGSLHPSRMVVALVGPYTLNRAQRTLEKFFGDQPLEGKALGEVVPPKADLFRKEIPEANYQSHVLIGRATFGMDDDRRRALMLLNNVLGGPILNSRLSMSLRERSGLAYTVESNYHPMSDVGQFQVYFACDPANTDKAKRLVYAEMRRLAAKGLTPNQLKMAKAQLMGMIALSNESGLGRAISYAKSQLLFDKVDTIGEVLESIEQITAEEVLEVAREVLDPNKLSELSYLTKD